MISPITVFNAAIQSKLFLCFNLLFATCCLFESKQSFSSNWINTTCAFCAIERFHEYFSKKTDWRQISLIRFLSATVLSLSLLSCSSSEQANSELEIKYKKETQSSSLSDVHLPTNFNRYLSSNYGFSILKFAKINISAFYFGAACWVFGNKQKILKSKTEKKPFRGIRGVRCRKKFALLNVVPTISEKFLALESWCVHKCLNQLQSEIILTKCCEDLIDLKRHSQAKKQNYFEYLHFLRGKSCGRRFQLMNYDVIVFVEIR